MKKIPKKLKITSNQNQKPNEDKFIEEKKNYV